MSKVVSPPELERVLGEWLARYDEWGLAFERHQEELLESGTSAASLELVSLGLEFNDLGPEVATPYLVERASPPSSGGVSLSGEEAFLVLLLSALALVLLRGTIRRLRGPRAFSKGAGEDLLT